MSYIIYSHPDNKVAIGCAETFLSGGGMPKFDSPRLTALVKSFIVFGALLIHCHPSTTPTKKFESFATLVDIGAKEECTFNPKPLLILI